MKRLLFVILIFSVANCRAVKEPPQFDATRVVASAKSIVVVSAMDHWIHGRGVGFFTGSEWYVEDPSFDINRAVLDSLSSTFNREVRVLNGAELGLVSRADAPDVRLWEEHFRARLIELGQTSKADVILVIHSASTRDWISQASAGLRGIGLCCRGAERETYCVLTLTTFDCASQRFAGSELLRRSRDLPAVEWKRNFNDYSDGERRIVYKSLTEVVEQTAPWLIAKVNLAKTSSLPPPISRNILGRLKDASYVPDGDEIKIPDGLSPEVANAGIIAGFRERGWNIESHTPGRIVGVISRRNRESVETAVVDKGTVVLTAERFELDKEGGKQPISPDRSWHQNLKESIVEELFKLAAGP